MIRIRDPHKRPCNTHELRRTKPIGYRQEMTEPNRTEPKRTETKRNEIRCLNRIHRDTYVILIHIRLSIRWRRSIFRHGFFRMMFRTMDPLSFAIFSSDQANFRTDGMFFFRPIELSLRVHC